jgi:hypothetical protein
MASRINHLAVLVSAIAFFILGALWYGFSPLGNIWMTQVGKTASGANVMASQYVITFLLDWLLAYVIGIALADSTNPKPARHGIEFGVFMGLGIYGTMTLMNYVFEGRTFTLWLINAGYVVIGMAIMGAIIGAWRKRAVPVSA